MKQVVKQSLRQLVGKGPRQQFPTVLCSELLSSDAFSKAAGTGGSDGSLSPRLS